MQVDGRQLRVVVEHLLEVGHRPGGVDAVAVEAAAQLVADAPAQHPVEAETGQPGRRPGGRVGAREAVAQEQLEGGGMGELGGVAEAAMVRVTALDEAGHRPAHRLRGRLLAGGQGGRSQRQRDLRGDPLHVRAPLPVGVVGSSEHGGEAGQAATRHRGEVGAPEVRRATRGEEDRHRPAALPGHRLDGLHVDRVDVGTLLPVDLDADEELVHQRGDAGVLEALVGHHVAPVAGAVPHREQDRTVPLPGGAHRLLTPRVPIDGVLRVLAEIGAGLGRQAVGRAAGGLSHGGAGPRPRLPPPSSRRPPRRRGPRPPAGASRLPAPERRCRARRARP